MSEIQLATTEAQALAEYEATIERGLQTFVDVGTALLAIRDGKLYRAEFGTFEDYAERRWGLKRQRAYELMSAATVASEISDSGLPAPTNEGQCPSAATATGEASSPIPATTAGSRSRARSAAAPGASAASAAPSGDEGGAA